MRKIKRKAPQGRGRGSDNIHVSGFPFTEDRQYIFCHIPFCKAGKAGEISLFCFLVVVVKTVFVFFKVIAVESVTVPAVVFQPVFNFIKVGINRVIAVFPGGGKVYGF